MNNLKLTPPRRYRNEADWEFSINAAISEAERQHHKTGYAYGIDARLKVKIYQPSLRNSYLEVVGIDPDQRKWRDR